MTDSTSIPTPPIPTPIPTLTLGDYLYSQGFRNTVARYRDDVIRKRPFNPSIVLPSRYVMDQHGRTAPNPAFRNSYQAMMGFYEDEVSGSLTGERLATGNIGELDEGVLKFCQARGIPLSPTIATGAAATQGDLSPFEVARIVALYTAKGFETAWDLLIAPNSTPGTGTTGTGTGTPTTTPPPSTGLDPTSAVIADLRQQLVDQTTLADTAAKRELSLRARFTSLLSKHKPPVRGGGAPTAKWREFWDAVSAELEKK